MLFVGADPEESTVLRVFLRRLRQCSKRILGKPEVEASDCNLGWRAMFSIAHRSTRLRTIAFKLRLEFAQELYETWIVSPFFLDPAMATTWIASGQGLRL
jgi:hypothetical protein